jgi:antitoxin HicB
VTSFPDLPGCHSDGETAEQAVVNGRDAVRSYLLSCKKHGDPIPKPSLPVSSSGQFRVRMPKILHARLVAQAEREGVSLNMLMVTQRHRRSASAKRVIRKGSPAAAAPGRADPFLVHNIAQ